MLQEMSKYVSKLPTSLQLMLKNINVYMHDVCHHANHIYRDILSDEKHIDFHVNTKYYA